ncbi:potassium-transporting ATPase subunit KdpC [Gracilimonas sediminicola]|uniref:potassium-transporting ATPase subunit KdpC n=1 Tax=Gracilimonas sediminicola TaxID=2952158 RepID=UPI0038D42901
MKKEIKSIFLLSIGCMLVFAVMYPAVLWGIAQFAAPNGGAGEKIVVNDQVVGFELIGQTFTSDRYFNSRPSAVGYDAAGTGGSNKGPLNPEYLEEVEVRRDSILAQNPEISAADIPTDMVTASGSGLDPHFSPQAAYMQVPRISKVRDIPVEQLQELVTNQIEKPLFGFLGPKERVHVLRLNIALDELDNQLNSNSITN